MTSEISKQVTQSDVARKAKVSRSVVSYVINNGPRSVSEETRERVLRAIETLHYRPNPHAQRLTQEQWGSVAHKQIGIVMCSGSLFERPYYGAILSSIQETAHAHHHHICFIRVFESFKNPVLLNQLVHKNEISGLILLSLHQALNDKSDDKLLGHILKRVDNIVCVDWEYEGLPSVNFDHYAAVHKATSHLLNLGHKAIAYIGPNDTRIDGFHATLAERGLVAQAVGIANTPELGYQQATTCGLSKFSAIVAGSDEVAFGIIQYCREQAISIPQHLALVSIDNIALSAFANPSLTTIDVRQKAIGEQAVKMLMDYHPEAKPQTVMTPIELIIRESCGSKLCLD